MPKDEKVAYAHTSRSVMLQKVEKHQMNITVWGNVLDYDGNTKVTTADLVTTKLLLNRVLGTHEVKSITMCMHNYYLETTLKGK